MAGSVGARCLRALRLGSNRLGIAGSAAIAGALTAHPILQVHSRCALGRRCGLRGEPSPGADVAEVIRASCRRGTVKPNLGADVAVRAKSRRRCARGWCTANVTPPRWLQELDVAETTSSDGCVSTLTSLIAGSGALTELDATGWLGRAVADGGLKVRTCSRYSRLHGVSWLQLLAYR
jgi:hypothetical protein